MLNSDNGFPSVPTTQSQGWVAFTYIAFISSLLMVGAGIVFLPIEIWMRGYLGIGVLMLVQSCITLAKTQRDSAKNNRLVNRVESARTEKILMGS
jgi:hypothetical protein